MEHSEFAVGWGTLALINAGLAKNPQLYSRIVRPEFAEAALK